jgi:hypothetical protein
MAYLTLKLSKRPAAADIQALQAELSPLAEVREPETVSYDLTGLALFIGLSADALQVVDLLCRWLQRTPKANEAVIRLSNGRELKLEANTDPEVFKQQLIAAINNL